MNTQMIIRIDEKIKNDFNKLARSNGQTVSEAIRELMQIYIQERDASSYINNLWGRIESEIKINQVSETDIAKIIKSSRQKNN